MEGVSPSQLVVIAAAILDVFFLFFVLAVGRKSTGVHYHHLVVHGGLKRLDRWTELNFHMVEC